jgi:hypothetical protein
MARVPVSGSPWLDSSAGIVAVRGRLRLLPSRSVQPTITWGTCLSDQAMLDFEVSTAESRRRSRNTQPGGCAHTIAVPSERWSLSRPRCWHRSAANKRPLAHRTTTSNLIAVRRLLLEPDDPAVCGPAPEQRCRLHRKRATRSMPWLLLSATGFGQDHPPSTGSRRRLLSS